jgi:hypothetical protein
MGQHGGDRRLVRFRGLRPRPDRRWVAHSGAADGCGVDGKFEPRWITVTYR